jgi:hypothetical protein
MKEEKTDKPQWKPTWKEGILFIGQIALCLLFYNSAGLDVLVYIGLAMLAVGFFVFGGMACGAFQKRVRRQRENTLFTLQLSSTAECAALFGTRYI